MTAACATESPADTTADNSACTEHAESRARPLAAVLDVQVAEVPRTANAFEHFFGDV
ncbi:hypothetical protein AB0P17_42335 [Streptomyces sp. NPDC088124]|uniref:hypothetical protein n=1 Tax=Streptomyces sp. NPDC088124 TaxID=3154654 RepID=UPI003438FDB9